MYLWHHDGDTIGKGKGSPLLSRHISLCGNTLVQTASQAPLPEASGCLTAHWGWSLTEPCWMTATAVGPRHSLTSGGSPEVTKKTCLSWQNEFWAGRRDHWLLINYLGTLGTSAVGRSRWNCSETREFTSLLYFIKVEVWKNIVLF